MIQNILVKIILFPFSLIYGLFVGLRNYFYNIGLLRSSTFSVPTISVGNLSVGGTGKTPHIEYLVSILKDFVEVGTLSRGYRRKTAGFLEIQRNMSALEAGDEPLQFKHKFGDGVMVAVGEDRALSIPRMLMRNPDLQVILLDDAYQHRSVNPYINILLTDYSKLFTDDFVLPAGRLREWPSSYQRAHAIIVTKCPTNLINEEAEKIRKKINPLSHQMVYFSTIEYDRPYYLFNRQYQLNADNDLGIYLLSGIANNTSMKEYVRSHYKLKRVKEFGDHHNFNKMEVANIVKEFTEDIKHPKKIILTTEKDGMRLLDHKEYLTNNKIPIFVLPIKIRFLFESGHEFEKFIKNRLLEYKS